MLLLCPPVQPDKRTVAPSVVAVAAQKSVGLFYYLNSLQLRTKQPHFAPSGGSVLPGSTVYTVRALDVSGQLCVLQLNTCPTA